MNKLPFDINEVKWQDFGEGIKSCVWKPDEKCCVQYWEIQPGIGAAPHSHAALLPDRKRRQGARDNH